MYLYIFIFVVTALSLKKSLDKIEQNTSKLKDYTQELLEKTRKVDTLINKLTS